MTSNHLYGIKGNYRSQYSNILQYYHPLASSSRRRRRSSTAAWGELVSVQQPQVSFKVLNIAGGGSPSQGPDNQAKDFPVHQEDYSSKSSSFDPCIWSKYFLHYGDPSFVPPTANNKVCEEHEKLKLEIRRMIVKIQTTPITAVDQLPPLKEKLRFVDTVQRLGLSYHFDKEISNLLQRVHLFDEVFAASDNDIYNVATAFRLLRDEGIFVPASVFEKFINDDDREFKETILSSTSNKVDGLIALYEASFFDVPGESILNQAREIAIKKLNKLKESSPRDQVEFEKLEDALCRPRRRNSERLVARNFISIYKMELTFGESLLKFAVHDFNIRQFGFQKELSVLTRWWDETNMEKEVPFARHRVVETFFLAIILYPEPQYTTARLLFCKINLLMVLLDDTYDTYGKMEELELFTDAFSKLNPDASPTLPQYMRTLIKRWIDIYAEIEQYNPRRPYILYYMKREVERLVRAYEVDAKWIRSKTIPTIKEYFDIALITFGVATGPCMFFAGMGEEVSEQILRWAADDPISNFVRASVVVCRCVDDLTVSSNEIENTNSGVWCYMKQYGMSEEEARTTMTALVEDAYKELNQGMLSLGGSGGSGAHSTNSIPKPILKVVFAFSQASDVFHRYGDSFSVPELLKSMVTSLLVEPVHGVSLGY